MKELLAPGLHTEEAQATPQITALRTDIAVFFGMGERGPVGVPVRLSGWEHFRARFGEFIPQAFLAYAVKAFFDNGGEACWVVRLAAPQATTQTAGPQPADRGSSVVAAAGGFAAGAVALVRQTRITLTAGPQPADRLSSFVVDVSGFPSRSLVEFRQGTLRSCRHVKARDMATNRLDWDQPLDAALNVALPIELRSEHHKMHRIRQMAGMTITWESPLEEEFSLASPIEATTGAARAALELLDSTSNATLRVRALEEGAWGNRLSIRVGRSSEAAAKTVAKPQPAGGESLIVDSVTALGVHTLIRLFQPGGGSPEYRVIKRVDVARRQLFWTGPLGAGFTLADAENGSHPISIESLEFALSIYLDGRLREVIDRLSLVAADSEHFVERAVERSSRLIRVEALPSPSPLHSRLPDPEAANLQGAMGRLWGGLDGLAAIRANEFLSALDGSGEIDEIAILAAPDLMTRPAPPVEKNPQPKPRPDPCLPHEEAFEDAPEMEPPLSEQAPSLDEESIARVEQAMIAQCERLKDRFAILDGPPASAPDSFSAIQSWRRRFDTRYAALYHPWLLVSDPLRLGGSAVRRVPPSGHVAGVYAQVDLEIGVHHAPANRALRWAQGPGEGISTAMQEILNPIGVNCLREFPGRGLRVWGARTMSGDASWRFVNVRRLVSMIEEALQEALAWAVFEPNDWPLRQQVTAAATRFLESLWERGALAGNVAEEAFFVRCDAENNPPRVADAGQLLVEIGVAPTSPAEFVVIRLGRVEDSFQVEEGEVRRG